MDRPGSTAELVIVANSISPYRVHLHKRIASEIPGINLHTVLTHARADFEWDMEIPALINRVDFGMPTESASRASRQPLKEFRKAGRIIRFLDEIRPKAVIIDGYADTGRLRLLRHLHRREIPTFIRGDSNILGDEATGIKRIIKKVIVAWAIKQATGVMVMGQLGVAYFSRYGADPELCYIVPREPDVQPFFNSRSRRPVEASPWDLPEDSKLLVFAGRLIALKRLDLLTSAFAEIASERPDWHLAIAGDGPLRAEAQSAVPTAIENRVHWLGFLEYADLVTLFGRGDVLVLPSDYEAWGLVVEEALAAGMLVVASDVVGAARELVRSGVNGYIFPAGDQSALVGALRMATDPERLVVGMEIDPYLEWKQQNDPVAGIVAALTDAGVLPAT